MKHWWKILAALFILHSIIWGLLGPVPHLDILNETIRNVYYHVPIWFAMLFQMLLSAIFAVRYLAGYEQKYDRMSSQAATVGIYFSILGIITGCMWARFTWGTWWTFEDPKLNGVAIAIRIYMAYFILRSSFPDENKRARMSAVYNIFAFVMMFVFIMILPRLTDSLHPGNGGNPAFGKYDLDNNMRLVFYPTVIGWVLMMVWIFQLKNRYEKLKERLDD